MNKFNIHVTIVSSLMIQKNDHRTLIMTNDHRTLCDGHLVSMLTLAQRRQWVIRLAFGWGWFYTVEPTLGQRILSMLSEDVYNTLTRSVGPTLGQCM